MHLNKLVGRDISASVKSTDASNRSRRLLQPQIRANPLNFQDFSRETKQSGKIGKKSDRFLMWRRLSRRPKSETRTRSVCLFGTRVSGFLRPSDFGLRISITEFTFATALLNSHQRRVPGKYSFMSSS